MSAEEQIESVEINVGSVLHKPPKKERPRTAYSLGHCWECNKPIGRTAKTCPHCGGDQSKRPAPMWVYIAAGVTVGAVIIGLFVIAMNQAQQQRELQKFEDDIRREYGGK